MPDSPNLKLPYLQAAQAQKHVTHNEALRVLDVATQLSVVDRDLTAPPVSPTDGDCYIAAAGATGLWAGQDDKIAAYQDNAWAFYAPKEGWRCWVSDENLLLIYDGAAWNVFTSGGGGSATTFTALTDTPSAFTGLAQKLAAVKLDETGLEFVDSVPLLGANASPDANNRLAISSPASLFNHEGAGHQVKVNKNLSTDTASFLFQTGFSGRAEIGTTGDDDFHFKVSGDGAAWNEAILIDRASGNVTFPNTPGLSGSGEANTSSNLGAGVGLAAAKSGIDLPFKSLVAGSNVTLTAGVDSVTIDAAGGAAPDLSAIQRDVRMLYLHDAERTGTVLGMIDGVADAFEDETGVDVANASGQTFDVARGLYHNPVGFDADTVAVLHGDDLTEATGKRTVTVVGAPTVSATAKIGTGSLNFTGNVADYLSLANHADLAFGLGDFTIEYWYNPHAVPTDFQVPVGVGSYVNSIAIYQQSSGGLLVFMAGASSTFNNAAWTPGTWVHIAVVREAGILSAYFDGVKHASTFDRSTADLQPTINTQIGKASHGNYYPVNGLLDEMRISKGVAHYSANFTPQLTAFGAVSNMTVPSIAFTADTAPATALLHLQARPLDAITINTDLIGEVSRDGGTTWTPANLVAQGTLSDGTVIYEDTAITISGQPSGTAMKWRLRSLNGKSIELEAVNLKWKS